MPWKYVVVQSNSSWRLKMYRPIKYCHGGLHPICVAVKLNSSELVKFILMRGADPNVMDSWDETPLSLAVILQNLDIIQLLIKEKANVNHMASVTRNSAFEIFLRFYKNKFVNRVNDCTCILNEIQSQLEIK